MQQEILLVGIKLDELLKKIETIVEEKLSEKESKHPSEIPATKYLSRLEVAKLLKISLPTLHDWTKNQILQSYKIGSRVLYKEEEVLAAIHQCSNLKFKKSKSW